MLLISCNAMRNWEENEVLSPPEHKQDKFAINVVSLDM
jgi:hypothetical protein